MPGPSTTAGGSPARPGRLFREPEFTLGDPVAEKLHDTLVAAYPAKPHIKQLVQRIGMRWTDLDTDGDVGSVWLSTLEAAARAGVLHDLVKAATVDPKAGGYREILLGFLADDVPDTADDSAADSLLDDVDALLADVDRIRSPILVALEVDGAELGEAALARTARHLTVTLKRRQVEILESVARTALTRATSFDQVIAAGEQVWRTLKGAEPRLAALCDRIVADVPFSQPVAWCGEPGLLGRLSGPLQIAHTGWRGSRGFLSVGAGGHYLMPVRDVGDAGDTRTMKHRPGAVGPTVARADLRSTEPDGVRAALGPVDSDVVVALQDTDRKLLADLAAVTRDRVQHRLRAALVFGGAEGSDEIDALLDVVPFVSRADVALAEPLLLDVLAATVRRYGRAVALPCIVAAVRAAFIDRAIDDRDLAAYRRGLAWSSWSWVGLPLFSTSYGEVARPLYPHLMDLRSVASREWYFDRKQRIKPVYQASALTQPDRGTDRFHLYLSGAGGTGKSCFLQHVYEELHSRRMTVAVLYRVDAPSSSWENLASRIREEVVKAVEGKLDKDTVDAVAQIPGGLGEFLRETAELLRERDVDEIAVFIDQLERTFESGDEPDPSRLETISNALIQLLEDVGVTKGVRVFVASRKQYLPDFLVSFRAAAECGLEFNVLQVITDTTEQIAFVRKVLDWCRDEQLVQPAVTMRDDAIRALVGKVDGNPLNMMLALIQLLSQNFPGAITEKHVTTLQPWSRLFQLDLDAADRDELDRYFLRAMAHARTEIVRFEEVWWRIRMVNPRLTRRVEELGSNGVRERLWLLGILGRTIHARPYGGEPMRFVEFFHANLRDHLLREVMTQGRVSEGAGGRRTGTPAAWRALDRLSAFAHDWAQTLQPLLAEEMRVLMEHRDEAIKTGLAPDEDAGLPFQLLFLRDPNDARERLSRAAMACFAYSALVRDEGGRWAVEKMFPDVDDRVAQCDDWLRRSPGEFRPAILRYLVELEAPVARRLLVTLLLDLTGADAEDMAQSAALVLAEPLYAARWRNEVLLAVLTEALLRAGGDPGRIAPFAVAFLAAACGRDRDTLLELIDYCVGRLRIAEDANLHALARALESFDGVDAWIGAPTAVALLSGTEATDGTMPGGCPIELVLGDELADAVTAERLAEWSATVRQMIGVPLPDIGLVRGEVEPDEAELRFHGRRVSRSVFRPGSVCVSKRLWDLTAAPRVRGEAAPDTVVEAVEGGEDVLWLPPSLVEQAAYRHSARDVDEAVTDWIESRCRRSFDELYDIELQLAFIREVAATEAGRRRLRRIGPHLRPVLVDLVEEAVPITSRDSLLEQMAEQAPRVPSSGALTRKIREFLGAEICSSVADDEGQVTTLLLDERLEERLADRRARLSLLSPAEAIRLDGAIQRLVVHTTERAAGPPLVLVTIPELRRALARLLHHLDHRLPVLSFTELDPSLIAVPGGLVTVALDPEPSGPSP